MKRLSNKRRGLIYIRQKNKLRKGGKLFVVFKISSHIIDDKDYIQSYIQNIVKEKSDKYKMPLNTKLEYGREGADFLQDMVTFKITLTKFTN